MSTNKTIGDKITELLELRDISRAELGRRTGLSTGLLSEICNNQRKSVMVDTVKKIAKALNVHPAYFIEDDTIGPSEILAHLSEEERNFISDTKSLPWLKLTKDASEKGLTPDRLKQIIDIVYNNK